MPVDPAVLGSIAGILEQDPANKALRLHLADLLLAHGQAGEALAHAAVALASCPDDLSALDVAARAAEAAGETAKAEGTGGSARRWVRRQRPSRRPSCPRPCQRHQPDVPRCGSSKGIVWMSSRTSR